MQATDLPDDLWGEELRSVRALFFAPADEPGGPWREAVVLGLGRYTVAIHAMSDSSEIDLYLGPPAVEPDYVLRDVGHEVPFADFMGRPLDNCWSGVNQRGYSDLVLFGFGNSRGLVCVAVNNEVEVLVAAGGLLV